MKLMGRVADQEGAQLRDVIEHVTPSAWPAHGLAWSELAALTKDTVGVHAMELSEKEALGNAITESSRKASPS
jgi:hypothetical protein